MKLKSGNKTVFIARIAVISILMPVISPLLGYAEGSDTVISTENGSFVLSIDPYYTDKGLMVDANDAAAAFGLDCDTDEENKTFTIHHEHLGDIVLMHNASEFYSNGAVYECDKYFCMENTIPMVELGFFCSMFGATYEYDSASGTISIMREMIAEVLPDTDPADYEEQNAFIAADSGIINGTLSFTDSSGLTDSLEVDLAIEETRRFSRGLYMPYGYRHIRTYDLGKFTLENGEPQTIYIDVSQCFENADNYGVLYAYYNINGVNISAYLDRYGNMNSSKIPVTYDNDMTGSYIYQTGIFPYMITARDAGNIGIELSPVPRGKYGGISWIIDQSGTLTIEGGGDIVYSPWSDYNELVKKVVLDENITGISGDLLRSMINLESIEVSESNTKLSSISGVLYNKDKTELIQCPSNMRESEYETPSGITKICDYAFSGCVNLRSITIPESVASIGTEAFSGCTGLESIVIPESVASIGAEAFSGCISLERFIVDGNNRQFSTDGCCLFNKNKTKLIKYAEGYPDHEYSIPESVTTIGSRSFFGCNALESIVISDSVMMINSRAFEECTSLMNVRLPESVTTISSNAFSGCVSLTNIAIPESVISIGIGAFSGCSSLESIAIPKSVISIGSRAFFGCGGIRSVTIPESVTYIGNGAFSSCGELAEIVVDSSNKFFCSEGGCLYNKNKTSVMQYAAGCKAAEYELPESITSIGGRAFSGCGNLAAITMPCSITSIGDDAFEECGGLKTVYYRGTQEQWDNINIGYGNDDLLNADINCEESALEPIPLTKATINTSETENSRSINISIEKAYPNSSVYAGIYDEDNLLIGIKQAPLNADGTANIEIDKKIVGSYVKILVWNDIMQPITEAKTAVLK